MLRRLSPGLAYDLWLISWDTALEALATATQERTLTTDQAARHRAVIAAEREFVSHEFTLLLHDGPLGLGRQGNSRDGGEGRGASSGR